MRCNGMRAVFNAEIVAALNLAFNKVKKYHPRDYAAFSGSFAYGIDQKVVANKLGLSNRVAVARAVRRTKDRISSCMGEKTNWI